MLFQEKLTHLIAAGFQIIYVATAERNRCESEILQLGEKTEIKVVTWDAITGFSTDNTCKDPIEALLTLSDDKNMKWQNEDIIFIFRNLHIFLEEVAIRQLLQNLYYEKKLSNNDITRLIIILAPIMQINEEITTCITTLEYELPNVEQLTTVFNDIAGNIEIDKNDINASSAITTYDEELKFKTIQALRGLTTIEAENALAYSLRVNRGFGRDLINTIEDKKAEDLRKTEILTYIPKNQIATMNEIGGYEELKDFINVRKLAYTQKAKELNIDLPKGIVLLGITGSGKSICAKVISREMELPFINLNISAVFGSLVGESERRIRAALAAIDALDGSVVLIDEAEKALGGASESVGDSGVARRVFGVILTWLAEKKSRTFVIMTMNKTTGIPPEFLRRGRFDEIFYTDLPDPIERDEILRIHCRKRGINVHAQDILDKWSKIIIATDRFVGAEIETVVTDARFLSFANRQTGQPTADEILHATSIITPIAEAEKEIIEQMRKMCIDRARPVSKRANKTATKKRNIKLG